MQSNLVLKYMDKPLFFVCETHLLHATHLQVNLDWFMCDFVFPDVLTVFSTTFSTCFFNNLKQRFCCQTVFDVFGSCMLFLEKFMEKFLDVSGKKKCF